jgi:hypothetical protein
MNQNKLGFLSLKFSVVASLPLLCKAQVPSGFKSLKMD